MVKRDASFYPLYTHTPLLGLIFHCIQLEVSLIYGMFPCTTDHYRCCDELPGIYLASIDFLIHGSKLLLKSLCCTSFLFLVLLGASLSVFSNLLENTESDF